MRKRFLTLILTVIATFTCGFGLVACGGDKNNGLSSSGGETSVEQIIESVSLNQTSATLEVGETLGLTATVYPSNATDKSVAWSSSNPSVATVTNGTVTAKSAGTATITVRTSNDNTATCSITVKPKEILPTSIYLNKSSIDLDEGAEETLTVTLLASDTTNRNIEWLILDTSVATVSNGTITAVGEGTTTLIATTSNGLIATCIITVKSQFVFEAYGGGYALKSYNGTAIEVTVPSTYKGKNVIAIGVPQTTLGFVPSGFANCTNVQKIVLPDTISTIQYAAFYNCINLKSVNMPTNVNSLGYYALYGCDSLEEISVSLDKYAFENFFAKATAADYKIPESLTTVKITGTRIPDNAFSGLTNLTSIESSDSVTSIGSYAFYGCNSLASVVIGDGVTSIGYCAFYNCDSLTSITIPDGVTSIHDFAFLDCSSLTSVTCSAFAISYIPKSKLQTVVLTSGDSIGASAFEDCYKLTSITIPDSVTSIGEYAFDNCDSLTSIEIPDSVTSIGEYAFANCDGLTSIEIPDRVTSIGNYVFYNCDGLTGIEIPDGVTSIGEYAFDNCDKLTKINYNATECADLSYDNNVFYNAGRSGAGITVTIGANVKKIPANLFHSYSNSSSSNSYVPKITTVVFEESSVCESIGDDAFSGCDSLMSIEIPDSVNSIGGWAFSSCSSLTSIIIPDSVNSIGGYAFNGCSSLTSIIIPDSVNSIGGYAFNGCSSLTSIEIPDSVTSIDGGAFSGCSSLTSIEIPDSVTSIGSYAFSGCSSLTSIVIPDSVTSIDHGAFSGCSSLTSIEIPDSVTSIDRGAFYGCSRLTEMTLPFVGASKTATGYQRVFGYIFGYETSTSSSSIISGATYQGYDGRYYYHYYIPTSLKKVTITGGGIGAMAFYNCSSLTSIVIPDSVTSIGDSAFYNCSSLTSIVIPDSVTSIGDSAFYYCRSLTSIEIPDSVTSIGQSAFRYCTSLTSITFEDTSTWYRTSNYTDWQNKTGGWQMDVSNPSNNASYFVNNNYYWYKL